MGLLAVLSMVGAFLGAERAWTMFNSVPLMVFWFLVAGLLIAGLVLFRRLLRSPGLLALHLGSLLILCGAMYGSEKGHHLAALFFGNHKIPSGYMVIPEGRASNEILDQELDKPIGTLPFSLYLKDFSIDFYELKNERWLLIADAGREPSEGENQSAEPASKIIEWDLNTEVPIPFTKARLKVLKYLDRAKTAYDFEAENALEVTGADGQKLLIPAKVGQESALENPKLKLRVVQVFSHLMVRDSGDKPLYTEVYLPLVKRHAELMMRGAKKYGKGNWKKACGEPEYERFKESLLRHVLQYISGDRDEDHLAAVLFNCHGAAMVEDKLNGV